MRFEITQNMPLDVKEWNDLANSNSNLLCSTYYDEIQSFYKQQPIYVHFLEEDKLIAGVKLYLWESRKIKFILPSISRSIMQFGEYIIQDKFRENQELSRFINSTIKNHILYIKAVWFKSNGFYGNADLVLNPFNTNKINQFDVALVNLNLSKDELMANLHSKHRNSLKKAFKAELKFEIGVKIEVLIDLIGHTYGSQDKDKPNELFIRKIYKELIKENNCILYAVKEGEKYLSAGMIQKYGKIADYTFGGNVKNNLGAGQFLHWQIITHLKEQGLKYYSFGQVATEKDETNLKFSKGISDFKMRFGSNRSKCFSQITILKPYSHKFFNLLIKFI